MAISDWPRMLGDDVASSLKPEFLTHSVDLSLQCSVDNGTTFLKMKRTPISIKEIMITKSRVGIPMFPQPCV
jgi:hypothetical protein